MLYTPRLIPIADSSMSSEVRSRLTPMTGIHFSKEVAENPVPFPAATMWAKKIDSSAARRECHVKP